MLNPSAAEYIFRQDSFLAKQDRHALNGHKSCVIWLTGLSGSGKTTIANALELQLHQLGKRAFTLDGDHIRHGLNQGLGFSHEDRMENIRRISEVAKLFVEAGIITITAFISPFREDRKKARQRLEPGEFIEAFIQCPLSECEQRDPKGLYAKARAGLIPDFTGISSPYEEPEAPEITIDSVKLTVDEAVDKIIQYLSEQQVI